MQQRAQQILPGMVSRGEAFARSVLSAEGRELARRPAYADGLGAVEIAAPRLAPAKAGRVHAQTRILLRPECWLRLLQAVPTLVAATRGTPGCLAFDVYVSATRPGEVTMIGCWASVAAVAAHGGAEHMTGFMRLAAECTDERPDITILAEV